MVNDLDNDPSWIDFCTLDAEAFRFKNNSFDAVVSGMVLGLIPDQLVAVKEMVRVSKPGGSLLLSTYGPALYFETTGIAFRIIPQSLILGYRIEFCPRREKAVSKMLSQAGLIRIKIRDLICEETFKDGGQAFDFFCFYHVLAVVFEFSAGSHKSSYQTYPCSL